MPQIIRDESYKQTVKINNGIFLVEKYHELWEHHWIVRYIQIATLNASGKKDGVQARYYCDYDGEWRAGKGVLSKIHCYKAGKWDGITYEFDIDTGKFESINDKGTIIDEQGLEKYEDKANSLCKQAKEMQASVYRALNSSLFSKIKNAFIKSKNK